MSNSDGYDKDEEKLKKSYHKKSKYQAVDKDKKRKRSNSTDSNNYEKRRKKKSNRKSESDGELNNDQPGYKTKKHKKKSQDDYRSKYEGASDNENSQLRNRDSNKYQKYSDDEHDKYPSSKKHKHARADSKEEHETKKYRKIYENNLEKEHETRFSDKDKKKYTTGKSERGKNDSTSYDDKHSRDSPGEDKDGKSTSSIEKPFRYWSTSRGPVRKNSDSYWNKYSDRLNEPPEHVEIGPRYYSSSKRGENDQNNEKSDKRRIVSDKDDTTKEKTKTADVPENVPPVREKKTIDLLTSRTGGAYIPPAKLKMMQESITDKASAAYQRLAWEALKKSIQGHVNKVNTSNCRVILKAVQKENIVRGRGLLCRSLIQTQAASPTFTHVYAGFIAALNSKFPKIGELLLKRLVIQFRRGFKRNDKTICITAATFIAHLVNQEVAHEILALQLLMLLIETPTDNSVEVAIAFLKECGMKLIEVSNKGVLAVFDMLRNILHEGKLEQRVQYMIEVIFQIRKEGFKSNPSTIEELDLVPEEDKIQHMITLEDCHDPEDILNVFKFDPNYEANEAKYKSLIDDDDSDEESEGEGGSGSGSSDEESDENEGEASEEKSSVIVDRTETNLVHLRKTIYLTIQSSLDFEECAHKLLRMDLKPGQEIELAHMFLDCCAEQRTYEKFFGLLAQRFCQINRMYIGPFEETFRDCYSTIHRMSNDKLRNVAKLFAHLLFTDAISWDVLATIRLNEDDTTSSSRIFIKILFLELSEYMGLAKLNLRVKDPSLQTALDGLFPRDNPQHTRFAINFFTSIGLGGLTDELREHLKAQPKPNLAVPQLVEGLSSSSSSSDSSSGSSDSSSSDSSSSDSSSESEDESHKKKKSRTKSASKKKKDLPQQKDKKKVSKAKKPSSKRQDR